MARLRLIFLSALAFAAFAFGRADATLCTVPNVFSNGSTINAAPFNSNFSALQTCGNNLDNSQVGSAGFYASNLKPTNGTQATFGGSQVYTFPSGVVAGPIVSQSGYVPPVYNISGGDPSSGSGMAIVEGTISVPSGGATVTLTGAAVFTSNTSYVVTATNQSNTANEFVNVVPVSGSQFSLYLGGGTTTQTFQFIAIGY
jgi:hypothetical protein